MLLLVHILYPWYKRILDSHQWSQDHGCVNMLRSARAIVFVFLLVHVNATAEELQTVAQNASDHTVEDHDNVEESQRISWYISVTCELVSLVLLVLTLVAYLVSPNVNNLHCRCLMAHCTFLIITYFIAVVDAFTLKYDVYTRICFYLDTTWSYFRLISFFWLQVMAFDIWRTFRKNLNMSFDQKQCKLFWIYFAFALIGPTILLIIGMSIEAASSSEYQYNRMGLCFREMATYYIFIIPTLVITISNLIFFVVTAIRIYQLKKETETSLNTTDSKTHNQMEQQRFKLYLKLFAVMGGPLILRFILLLIKLDSFNPKTRYIVFVTVNVITHLQGLMIFIVCVWLTKYRKYLFRFLLPAKLMAKLKEKRNVRIKIFEQTTSPNTSTSDATFHPVPNSHVQKTSSV
ncbi:hypothetical protein B566_EDAN002328 [Ephemera danica]|nr:hypothetical protein B566_EDAN002328 [Ephemera danica]